MVSTLFCTSSSHYIAHHSSFFSSSQWSKLAALFFVNLGKKSCILCRWTVLQNTVDWILILKSLKTEGCGTSLLWIFHCHFMLWVIKALLVPLMNCKLDFNWKWIIDNSFLCLLFKGAFSSEQFAHSKLKWLSFAHYSTADISSLFCVFGTEQQASSSSSCWSCMSPEVLLYFSVGLLQPLKNFTKRFFPLCFLYNIVLLVWKTSKFSHWIWIYLS